jgi:hypothetical protein
LKNQLEAENVISVELQNGSGVRRNRRQSDAIKHVQFKINQVAATDLTV